jgi:D-arabinose 1-dehydrogenase-like Zn-dependent alcohol dehydrogenase
LPERVDAVMDTVGQATWSHSLKSLKPGGTLVISGATSGQAPKSAELNRIFFLQLRVQGSTIGTRAELAELMQFMTNAGISPHIDSTLPLADARKGFAAMRDGDLFGKIVFTL